jgi:Holliday junction resolvase RusA-like endonuclease
MISFWVPGIPQPGGSKRAFVNRKTGRVIVTEDAKHNKTWRASVAQAARDETTAVLQGPLSVRFEFVFVRPAAHYGKRRGVEYLKPSAPPYPAKRPDASKLTRSTEDALTGILWRDDSQIVTQFATKRYGPQAGALITVVEEKG